MIFIEKENSVSRLECGDFILFEDGILGIVVIKESKLFGIVQLHSGRLDDRFNFIYLNSNCYK